MKIFMLEEKNFFSVMRIFFILTHKLGKKNSKHREKLFCVCLSLYSGWQSGEKWKINFPSSTAIGIEKGTKKAPRNFFSPSLVCVHAIWVINIPKKKFSFWHCCENQLEFNARRLGKMSLYIYTLCSIGQVWGTWG